MGQPHNDQPTIFELSELGQPIQAVAKYGHVELDTYNKTILGELDSDATESVEAEITFQQRVGKFACEGIVYFPEQLTEGAESIFSDMMQSFVTNRKLDTITDTHTAVRIGTKPAYIVHLEDNDPKDFPAISITAVHDAQNASEFLRYRHYDANEVVREVGRLVAAVANSLHEETTSPFHATLDITLPEMEEDDAPQPHDHKNFPKFEQFGGLDTVIEKLKDAASDHFIAPELLEKYGLKPKAGILLQGPPGNGKTELVQALSRELRIGYKSLNISDIMSMWVGESGKQLRATFDAAQKSGKPTLLFFDEADGLFGRDAGGNSGAARSLISEAKQILSDASKYPNVLVIYAVNSLEGFDPALLRPGRFDTILKISDPNEEARTHIFQKIMYAHDAHFDIFTPDNYIERPIDTAVLARKTDGYSGADIRQVLDGLLWEKMRHERTQTTDQPRITQTDIERAIREYNLNRPSDI